MNEMNYDVIVIGGGASGTMAAGRAAELGHRVLLIEKNPVLGQKLSISGGGRCNITNAEEDIHKLLAHYGEASKFLYSAFAQFGVRETFSFFEKLGVPLIEQARQRVFPVTEQAQDVVRALERYLETGKVTVITNAPVTRVLHDEQRIIGVVTRDVTYTAQLYILATGGLSHPETGSTGDGFDWLRELGHRVATPTPTVVPLATQEKWSHALTGVSLPFAKVTVCVDGVKKLTKKGPILFTHFGLSGPTILNMAGVVGDLLHTGIVTIKIDATPELDHQALDEKMLAIFDANKNKMIKNVMSEIVPGGLTRALWTLLPAIDPDTKVNEFPRQQRKQLIDTIKALPVTVTGLLGFDKAVVVDGGVDLAEIDTKTMRSKKIANLLITGDLLHINRPSGGYSLQLCWTTGFVAGSNTLV